MLKGCLILIMVLLLSGASGTAQIKPLPIQRIDSMMAVTAKPVLILLSTEWCKYCQMQKSQIGNNKDFANKASQFYYVELDAEGKQPIYFNGHTYNAKSTDISKGIHELAVALNGSERMSFPTWVVLNKKYEVLFRYNGVLSAKQLEEVLLAL